MLRANPLPFSKQRRHILERDDLGPPVVPGGQEISLGSRNFRPGRSTSSAVPKERLTWTFVCAQTNVLRQKTRGTFVCAQTPQRCATWPNGEWGYSNRCHMLGRECPEAVLPDRALYLPTLSHLLIVNKVLSLSLPPSPPPLLLDIACSPSLSLGSRNLLRRHVARGALYLRNG